MSPGRAKQQDAREPDTALQNGVEGWPRDLAAILSTIGSNDAFLRFVQIDEENQTLKNKNAELETTIRTNMGTIARSQQEWETERAGLVDILNREREIVNGLRAERVEADDLSREIKDHEHRYLALMETMKKKDDEMTREENVRRQMENELRKEQSNNATISNTLQTTGDELTRSKMDLADANASLATVRSFLVELQPMAAAKAQIRTALDDIFNRFLEFFVAEFNTDVDADVATTDNVEELSLSLPASNSAAAKQMRVVAGLMVSGRALAYYVFRKTFVTPTNHLDKALGRLVDAEHQSFVRAVLRRVLPEEQLGNQEAGIEDAIDEILNAVQRWVPDADGFVNRLRPLCEEASRAWILTLNVQNWIAPIFNPSVPEHWRPVPHISAEIASKPDPASQNKQRARNPKPPAPATSSRPNPAKLNKNQIARVV